MKHDKIPEFYNKMISFSQQSYCCSLHPWLILDPSDSVTRFDEEGVIPEPITLTVSLRGTREVRDSCQIFRLAGLLDAFSEPTFRKVLESFVQAAPKNIILDLSKIDFIDSSGLGALVQIAKKAQTAGATFQVVTNPRVTQTVKLVRLEKFLALQETLDAALQNVKA